MRGSIDNLAAMDWSQHLDLAPTPLQPMSKTLSHGTLSRNGRDFEEHNTIQLVWYIFGIHGVQHEQNNVSGEIVGQTCGVLTYGSSWPLHLPDSLPLGHFCLSGPKIFSLYFCTGL